MSWKEFDYAEWKKANEKFDHDSYNIRRNAIIAKNDFTDMVESLLGFMSKNDPPPWKPMIRYCEQGDILQVILSDVNNYYKWLLPGLSLMLCCETNEIVGIQIEGLSKVENIEKLNKWMPR